MLSDGAMGYFTGTDNLQSSEDGNVTFADPSAAALLSENLPKLLHPDRYGWERIKQSVSRTVYRGEVRGEGIYVKHYHSRSLGHRVGRRLGISGARREMRFSRYLNSHGISAMPALASMCDGNVEWLATRGVAPSEPADSWHTKQLARGTEGRKVIQKAIISLGEMVGRMHAAGVLHRDLHCGNILVCTDTPDPSLVLTDLHRATMRGRLSRRARAANLAQLYHDRYDFTTRTERLRFLKHYLRSSGAGGTVGGWRILVERFARGHTNRQRAQRDRRILRCSQYFTTLRLGRGWRGHVVLESKRRIGGSRAAKMVFSADDWGQVLRDPRKLLDSEGAEIVKDSRSSLVVHRTLQVGPHSVDVFIKRARRKRPRRIIADCFRLARSIRAFKLGHMLLTRRIATAVPLVALERRFGPFLRDSILITETVDNPNLSDFLNTWLAAPPRGETPRRIARQRHLGQQVLWGLGRMLQRLHDNNFAHRDLKATNMHIHWSLQSPPEIVLVDLDGVRRKHYLTMRRKFQGLMRLNVSLLKCPVVNRAGRLRMLLGYLRRPGSGRIDFKRYWRVLEDWSERKLQHQIRSRRRRQRAARRPAE